MEVPTLIHTALVDYLSDPQHTLTPEVITWCKHQPVLKPARPLTLYRGLFFCGDHPDHYPAEDFLQGSTAHTQITVTQPQYSSWTSVRGVARRFSLNSKGLSFTDMTKEFLSHYPNYHNPVGIVLSDTFTPSEILLSVERLAIYTGIRGPYGREWEYLVNPFKNRQVMIEEIYTPISLHNAKKIVSLHTRVI